jgi:hypothetical protein
MPAIQPGEPVISTIYPIRDQPTASPVSANQLRSDGGSSWKAGSSVGRSLSPLYVAVRLVLRHYCPPDTPRLRLFLGVVPLLPGGISRREYAVVYLAGLTN